MDAQHNPWATQESQGNPYMSPSEQEQHQQRQQQQQYQPPPQPYSQQPSTGWSNPQDPEENPFADYTSPIQSQPHRQPQSQAPPQGIRRSDTDDLLESQPDRGEQIEHMQHYEASKPQSEDDKNQETLQKEFPGIDSSLIAAIYNDHKQGSGRVNLAEIREMLQELQS